MTNALNGRMNAANLRTQVIQGYGADSPVVTFDMVQPSVRFQLKAADMTAQQSPEGKLSVGTSTDTMYLATGSAAKGGRVAVSTTPGSTTLTTSALNYVIGREGTSANVTVSAWDVDGEPVSKTALTAGGNPDNTTELDLNAGKVSINVDGADLRVEKSAEGKLNIATGNDTVYLATGTDGRFGVSNSGNITRLTTSGDHFDLKSEGLASVLGVKMTDDASKNGSIRLFANDTHTTNLSVAAPQVTLDAAQAVQLRGPHVEVRAPGVAARKVAFSHDAAGDSLVINGSGDYGRGVAVPSALAVKTDGLVVTGAGFVGVGTAAPVSKFHVNLPADIETHNVQKFVLASASTIDLKGTSINFTDPASAAGPHQALQHDVSANVLRINNAYDFAGVSIGKDTLVVDSTGNARFNNAALTVVGSKVGVGSATPAYPLDVAGDARIGGSLIAPRLAAAPGEAMQFKSDVAITLDAPFVNFTGVLNVINKSEINIDDYLLVLAKQGASGDQSNATLDGSGLKLDHVVDHKPANVDPAKVEQSIRWRARGGLFNADGSAVPTAAASRWELGGGNFLIKGPAGTSYMFGVDPVTAELQLLKVTMDSEGVETQTVVSVFSDLS